MPNEDLAEASVKIEPDLDSFKEELEAKLEEATSGVSKTVHVTAEADTTEAVAELDKLGAKGDELDTKKIEAKVSANAAQATAEFDKTKAEADELDAKKVDPKVGADATEWDAKKDAVKAGIAELGAQAATVRIRVDTGDSGPKIAEVKAEKDEVGKDTTAHIRIDTGDDLAKLTALNAYIDTLRAKLEGFQAYRGTSLPINADISGLARTFDQVQRTIPASINVGNFGSQFTAAQAEADKLAVAVDNVSKKLSSPMAVRLSDDEAKTVLQELSNRFDKLSAKVGNLGSFKGVVPSVDLGIRGVESQASGIGSALQGITANPSTATAGAIDDLRNKLDSLDVAVKRVQGDASHQIAFGHIDMSDAAEGLHTILGLVALVGPAFVNMSGVAVGALAAIPGAMTGITLGLGTIVTGLLGPLKALQAYGQYQQTQAATTAQLSESALQYTAQQVASAQQIGQAQQNLTLTMAQAANSQRQALEQVVTAQQNAANQRIQSTITLEQSQQSLVQAEQSLQSAEFSEEIAQRSLTQARIDAANQIVNLRDQMADSANQIAAAQTAIIVAQQELNQVMADPRSSYIQRQQAEETYNQALQQLQDLKDQNSQLAQTQATANAQGVDGATNVLQAQQGLTQAQQATIAAAEALTIAQQQNALTQVTAVQQVTAAQNALTDAIANQKLGQMQAAIQIQQAQQSIASSLYQAGVQAQEYKLQMESASNPLSTFTNDLKQLSPLAAAFVTGPGEGLYQWYQRLQQNVQGAIFGPLTSSLNGVVAAAQSGGGYLGLLNNLFVQTGTGLGNFIKQFFALFQGSELQSLNTLLHDGLGFLDQFGQITLIWVKALIQVGVVGEPILNALMSGWLHLSQAFESWTTGGGLSKFVAWVTTNGPHVADFFHSLIDVVGRLLALFSAFGALTLPILTDVLNVLDFLLKNQDFGGLVVGLTALFGVVTLGKKAILDVSNAWEGFLKAGNKITSVIDKLRGVEPALTPIQAQLQASKDATVQMTTTMDEMATNVSTSMQTMATSVQESMSALVLSIQEAIGTVPATIDEMVPQVDTSVETIATTMEDVATQVDASVGEMVLALQALQAEAIVTGTELKSVGVGGIPGVGGVGGVGGTVAREAAPVAGAVEGAAVTTGETAAAGAAGAGGAAAAGLAGGGAAEAEGVLATTGAEITAVGTDAAVTGGLLTGLLGTLGGFASTLLPIAAGIGLVIGGFELWRLATSNNQDSLNQLTSGIQNLSATTLPGLTTNINIAQTRIKALQDTQNQLNGEASKYALAAGYMSEATTPFSAQIEQLNNKLEQLRGSGQQNSAQFKDTQSKMQALEVESAKWTSQNEDAAQKNLQLRDAAAGVGGAISVLQGAVTSWEAQQKTVNTNLNTMQQLFDLNATNAQALAQAAGVNLTQALGAGGLLRLSGELSSLANQANVTIPQLEALAQESGQSVVTVAQNIGSVISQTKQAFSQLNAQMAQLPQDQDFTTAANTQITNLTTWTANVKKALSDNIPPGFLLQLLSQGPTASTEAELAQIVSLPAGQVKTILGNVNTAMSQAQSTTLAAVQSLAEQVATKGASVNTNLTTALTAIAANSNKSVTQQITAASQAVSGGLDTIQGLVKQYPSDFSKTFAAAMSDPKVLSAAKAAGANVTKGVASGMTSPESLFTVVTGGASVVNHGIGGMTTAGGISSPSSVAASKVGVPLAEGVAEGMTQSTAPQKAAGELVNNAVKALSNTDSQNAAAAAGATLATAFSNGFIGGNATSKANSSASALASGVVNIFKSISGTAGSGTNLGTGAYGAGQAVVAGFVAGIADEAQKLQLAAGQIVQDALNAMKQVGQISSPSRRAWNEIGAPIAQGIAGGITANLGLIRTAANAAVSAAMVHTPNLTVPVTTATNAALSGLKVGLTAAPANGPASAVPTSVTTTLSPTYTVSITMPQNQNVTPDQMKKVIQESLAEHDDHLLNLYQASRQS